MSALSHLAWQTDRPLFNRLPECYQTDSVGVLALFWDRLLQGARQRAEAFNPIEEDLDFARHFLGFSEFWVPTWEPRAKRALLLNAYQSTEVSGYFGGRNLNPNGLWVGRGTLPTLNYVFDALGIPAYAIAAGDFLVGTSEVGDPIGESPWTITVVHAETIDPRQLNWVLRTWKPAYVSHRFEQDNSRFRNLVALNGLLAEPTVGFTASDVPWQCPNSIPFYEDLQP